MMPKTSVLAVGLVAMAAASAVATRTPEFYMKTAAKFQELASRPRELVAFARELAVNEQRKCAEGDNQCLANCAKKFNKFDGEACFGLQPGESFLENEGFNALDNLLPNGDNVTNAELDKFCPCGGKVSSLMRTSISVFECALGEFPEPEGGGPSIQTILGAFDTMVEFMCIKNGADYCQVIGNSELVDVDEFNATDPRSCNALTALGCCTASLIELLESDDFKTLVGDSSGELDGIAEFKDALATCGLADAEPCLKPGQSATYTKATITLQADFAPLQNETKLFQFKTAFSKDVAKSMDVSPLQVEILSVTEGSIVVDFRIRGDVTQKLNTALSAGIPLNNTRSVDSSYSSVEDADSDDASGVQTEQVTNDADTAPAPAFGPASTLVLLLAAALAAFFL